MTLSERILTCPGLADFPAGHLEHILASRSLSGATDANKVELSTINLCIADTLTFAVNMPDFSENKLSISYPRSYFINTAKMLYVNNGEPEKASLLGRAKVRPGIARNSW